MGTLPPEITQEGARKDLEDIQKVFDSFGVRLFVTYGALLGLYRDGNFIPYDDDIDLCVIDKIDYKTRKDIGWALFNIGFVPQMFGSEDDPHVMIFKVYGRYEHSGMGYNGDEHSGIITCQRNIRVTLFFFSEEPCDIHERDMTCVPMYKGARLIFTPAHFFDKPDIIKFKGKKYLTPSPIKEYLTFMYGKDWKKPLKGVHAPQWSTAHPNQDSQT